MAQFGRPTSDIAAGDWGVVPLFSKVDEAVADDADFITGTGDLPCELALGAVVAPLAGTVTIRVRYRKDTGLVDLIDLACAVLEGTTVIATHTFVNIPDTWTSGSFTLTTQERDAITNWGNLRLRLTRTVGTPANAVYYGGQLITYGGAIVTYTGLTAAAPAWIDPETLSWPDAPMTISAGGTYTGLRIQATDTQHCITIQTANEVTLVDCDFYGGTLDLIRYLWGASKLTVTNCRFFGRVPATAGQRNGRAIDIQFGTKLHFRNNYVQGTMGVYVGSFEQNFDADIRFNRFRGIDGRASDGAGGRDNTVENWYRCQAVQFNGATAMKVMASTSTVAWNEVWNPFDEAWAEDMFSFYATGGASGAPFIIERNLVSRAARIPSTTTLQYSGGGIIMDGGSNYAGEYVIIRNNTIVETTNYGVAIAGGAYNTAEGNLILRSGYNDLDEALSNWDNGIYVRDYSSTDPARWGNHSVINNDIGWQMANGTFYNLSIGDAGPNLTNTGNTLRSGTITKSDIDAAVIAWRQSVIAAGHTIGATR